MCMALRIHIGSLQLLVVEMMVVVIMWFPAKDVPPLLKKKASEVEVSTILNG